MLAWLNFEKFDLDGLLLYVDLWIKLYDVIKYLIVLHNLSDHESIHLNSVATSGKFDLYCCILICRTRLKIDLFL